MLKCDRATTESCLTPKFAGNKLDAPGPPPHHSTQFQSTSQPRGQRSFRKIHESHIPECLAMHRIKHLMVNTGCKKKIIRNFIFLCLNLDMKTQTVTKYFEKTLRRAYNEKKNPVDNIKVTERKHRREE